MSHRQKSTLTCKPTSTDPAWNLQKLPGREHLYARWRVSSASVCAEPSAWSRSCREHPFHWKTNAASAGSRATPGPRPAGTAQGPQCHPRHTGLHRPRFSTVTARCPAGVRVLWSDLGCLPGKPLLLVGTAAVHPSPHPDFSWSLRGSPGDPQPRQPGQRTAGAPSLWGSGEHPLGRPGR